MAAVRPAGPDPMMMTLRNVLIDDLFERILVGETDDLLDYLAALEEEQRRDPTDAELERGVGVLIDVELPHDDLAVVIAGELVDRRREPLAGAAPLRPEIHQHRLPGVNRAVEVPVRNRLNLFGCH